MLLDRGNHPESALKPFGVVVRDVFHDHIDQSFPVCKAFSVISLPLQDAPESLHRSIVDASASTGHALRHPCLFKFGVELTVRVLVPPVTMEERMGAWIGRYGLIQSLEYQRIVVVVTDHCRNDTAVIEIQDCTEIDLVNHRTFIPFELCDVSQPLLIGLVCMEFTVQQILGNMLRICSLSCAAMIGILDRGSDIQFPADSQYTLVIHGCAIVYFQVVPDASVALIRALCVDFLYHLSDMLVFILPGRDHSTAPFVVRGLRDAQDFACLFYRII